MIKENALMFKEHSITLEATGSDEKDALGKIFNKLKKDIYKEIDEMIVHMEPKNIHIIEMEKKEFTEKFLFFFMPRTKEEVRIKATIVVNIKYISLDI